MPRWFSNAPIHLRALGVAIVGAGSVAAVVMTSGRRSPPLAAAAVAAVSAPQAAASAAPPAVAPRRLPDITPEERRRGHHDCNPPDRLGLGPYRPYVKTSQGRLAIPQRGGMTEDHGYDVLIHFHGADPARKVVVQVARGVAFLAIDKGLGSGPYLEAFRTPDVWQTLKRSVNAELQQHTGDPAAHVRHFALSSWSAGYGAVVQILKQDPDAIDAVVLLDSLHASYRYGLAPHQRGRLAAVDTLTITPIIDYARRAAAGEKILVVTHSGIDPIEYPSVSLSTDALLRDVGLERKPASGQFGSLEQLSAVDVEGLHVWAFSGRDETAHCAHLTLLARALTEIVEAAWQTPEMARDVPPTPAPLLGGGRPEASRDGGKPLLERVYPASRAAAGRDEAADAPARAPERERSDDAVSRKRRRRVRQRRRGRRSYGRVGDATVQLGCATQSDTTAAATRVLASRSVQGPRSPGPEPRVGAAANRGRKGGSSSAGGRPRARCSRWRRAAAPTPSTAAARSHRTGPPRPPATGPRDPPPRARRGSAKERRRARPCPRPRPAPGSLRHPSSRPRPRQRPGASRRRRLT